MRDSSKYISSQIINDIPEFIRDDYPNFVAFIVAYYQWMEQEGQPYQFISNILNYDDVDRTSLEFLNTFGRNFLTPLPNNIYQQNNIATLVKNIQQYYGSRGNENAFRFLFRLFDFTGDVNTTNIQFYYPSSDMLRVSDGKWIKKKSVKIENPPSNILDFQDGEILGSTSGAKAVIDEIDLYKTDSGIPVAELYLLTFDVVNSPEKFIEGEGITGISLLGETFTLVPKAVFYGVNITNPGKYYYKDQRVYVSSSLQGENAQVVVDLVTKGQIDSFTIINGGSGYSIKDKIYTVVEDFGSGAFGLVGSVDGSGSITSITMMSNGHDYRNIPRVFVQSVNGSGAIIFAESTSIGGVDTLETRDFGINYYSGSTSILFNTMIRIKDLQVTFDIGEVISGGTSGANGIIEYWDQNTGVMSIKPLELLGNYTNFTNNETITGNRWGGTATIYDQSTASGTIVEGILCNYKGSYVNEDGQLSALKYIQDSYFYQMFSYMIRTKIDKSQWKDYIQHTHPAGTIGFSYRDATSQYHKESYGGFIGPKLDTIEYYKCRWNTTQYHGGFLSPILGNTQVDQYQNVVVDDIANINTDILNKTGFTYGSEITIIN